MQYNLVETHTLLLVSVLVTHGHKRVSCPSCAVLHADCAQMFSSLLPSDDTLAAIFGANHTKVSQQGWMAYPRFSAPERFAPFRLLPGLCYVNAIENAASAMEMSAIAGRNCALMAAQHLAGTR